MSVFLFFFQAYPMPLWDRRTGLIDRQVAAYTRDHRYDLSNYLQQYWPEIGGLLIDNLHIYCGDTDVERFEPQRECCSSRGTWQNRRHKIDRPADRGFEGSAGRSRRPHRTRKIRISGRQPVGQSIRKPRRESQERRRRGSERDHGSPRYRAPHQRDGGFDVDGGMAGVPRTD